LNRHGFTRDKHFIKNLAKTKRHEIHVIQHTQPYQNKILSFINPPLLMESFKDWTIFKDGIYHHHLRHVYFTRFHQILKFNNLLFKKSIKKIVKEYKIEVMICGPNHYLHGYPPANLGIPLIFDYLDFLHDFKDPNRENTEILSGYYKKATKILCISKTLIESMPPEYKEKSVYLPNGVDLEYYKSYKSTKKRSDIKYISLIGISISESLFYLDILPKLKEKIGDTKLLLVGGGPRLPQIVKYIKQKKNREDYILEGFIPYEKIRKYFYLTDVGLYPTLKNRYYDSACPLKVFEYSAAGKPVVSTGLEELKRLKFPNVFLANPTPKDFINKISDAINYHGSFPNLNNFTWENLTRKLEDILKNI